MGKEQQVILLIILILVVGIVLYVFFVPRVEDILTGGNEVMTNSCEMDVFAAQDSALGQVCTQQIRTLLCPDDASFAYEAPNGCEISFLESKSWLSVGFESLE